MTAPFKEYPYEPRFVPNPEDVPDFRDIQWPSGPAPTKWSLPFIPKFQYLPSGQQPSIPGYPWWVDPTFLNPPPTPALPPPPSSPIGPTDRASRSGAASTNWLESYYNQDLAQQGGAQSDDSVDATARDDASQRALPERRLG